MAVQTVVPALDLSVRYLCRNAYPNHRHGCPNYNKKDGCPPSAPLLEETLDLSCMIYAIYNVFPFGKHVRKMGQNHTDWSQRQKECCLYWQGTARKQLRRIVQRFVSKYPYLHVVWCPEAQGVNVTKTMKRIGVELKWPPVEETYQIVLAGTPLTVTAKEG